MKPSCWGGRPLRQGYVKDRSYLFLRYVYGSDQNGRLHPSSFAVIGDNFCSFFGREPLFTLADDQSASKSPAIEHPVNQVLIPAQEPEHHRDTEEEQLRALREQDGCPQFSLIDKAAENLSPCSTELSTPIPLEQHLSGPPHREIDVTRTAPLAAGFEDELSKAPVSQRMPITIRHYTASQTLSDLDHLGAPNLVVFFLFCSREYIKFFTDDSMAMRLAINDLSRDHYFLIIKDDKIISPRLKDLVEETTNRRLLLVGQTKRPYGLENRSTGLVKELLEDYISKYDAHTGKRRAAAAHVNMEQPPLKRMRR